MVLCDNGSSSTISPQMQLCLWMRILIMATRAGCDNALAILAIVLSFTENAADFVAPTPVYYIAILRLIF